MKKVYVLASLLAVVAFVLTACGGGGAQASDVLGAIKQRGYILVSTDPNYAPQSFLNKDGKRPDDTKCPEDALTSAEMQGFDVDVAKAIGESLGVETCFATPDWDTITAGTWSNKWDVSVGSMTITPERQQVLDFSVPYYGTPAVVAVGADSTYASLDELAGMALCAGASTTYETWLNSGDLGPSIAIFSKAPAVTVVNENIASGLPVKQLGEPVFTEVLAAAFDKSSSLPTETLRAEVDKLFTAMHSDGRLTALSKQWFEGIDLTLVNK